MSVAGRLAGKRALLTGAGGALGSALCRAFAAAGADLVLSTRSSAKLDPLLVELSETGVRAIGAACDFTKPSEIDALAECAWAAFGGIDVVVLSSQPPQPALGSLLDCEEPVWREQMETAVWGPLRLMRALAPRMSVHGGGSVISFISSTGLEPIPDYGAYGLAKGALWNLTKYMAAEWGPIGIRANAICPGLIATGDDEAAARHEAIVRGNGMLSRTALGRVGRNSDVVGAAIYLASEESAFTTGQKIHIDGGRI